MTITVPTTLEDNPLFVIVNGVQYALGPGETITIPDAIGNEMLRMIAAQNNPAPGVELPFEDAAANQEIESLKTRMTAAEAAIAVKELPEFPETAGTYGLQLVMADGEPTLTWEAAADSGGGGDGK